MRSPLIVLAALALAPACSSPAPADDAESTASDLSTHKTDKTTTAVDVPITAAALHTDLGTTYFDWPDLWQYTKLARLPRLAFAVPPSDGESCDDACLAKVVARAAAHGGKLSGTLTVTRSFGDLHRDDGTCALVLRETVKLDLRHATHGIAPDLEATFGFLVLEDLVVPGVEIQDIPCPK